MNQMGMTLAQIERKEITEVGTLIRERIESRTKSRLDITNDD